jgi:hypothetical protein
VIDEQTVHGVWMSYVPDHERDNPAWASLDIPGHDDLTGTHALHRLYTTFTKANGQPHMAPKRFLLELRRARSHWYLRGQVRGVDSRPRGVKVTTLLGVPRDPTLRPAQYRQAKLVAVEDEWADPPEGQLIEIQQQLLADLLTGSDK